MRLDDGVYGKWGLRGREAVVAGLREQHVLEQRALTHHHSLFGPSIRIGTGSAARRRSSSRSSSVGRRGQRRGAPGGGRGEDLVGDGLRRAVREPEQVAALEARAQQPVEPQRQRAQGNHCAHVMLHARAQRPPATNVALLCPPTARRTTTSGQGKGKER